jgi:signal transduction histidine kinase/ligand-binding sensor domain-containing protein
MKPRLVPQTILGFLLVALVCPGAAGLDPSRKISQYGHNMWRIQDGYLPAPPEAIAQTGDGYLWMGTDAGLVRFDGVRFVPWASERGERLPSDRILYLLGASDGSLWIGTRKGLARWKGGILTTYKNLANSIWGIVEDHDGDIWIVRWDNDDGRGPLCRIRESGLRCFGRNDGIPLPTATGLALDSSGNFWISGNQGLCKWKPGSPAVYFHRGLAERGYLMGVRGLSVLNESHVWIGLQQPDGNLQLQEFRHGKWTAHPLPKAQGPPPSTNRLFRDREGALWIGTASDGVYRIFGDKTDHFSNADGLSSDSVVRFFQDREGTLWVATTKGIDSFRDLPVVSYSIKEGLVSDSVSTVLASHDGGVWIGGAEALGFLKQDKLSAIRTNHGLPGRDITTMSEDRHGRLWIGVDSSLSVLDHGHFLPIHKPDGSSLGIVLGIAEDAAGNEWSMTSGKLFRIENLKVRQQISLPQECFSIVGDSKEGVWLGCANGDLTHYYSSRSETFPRVSGTSIRQLLPEPGGGLWAVAEDTLTWWNDNKAATMTSRNGLPCNELYAAVKDNAGTLWLYARCGLFSVAASQLTLWHENPSMQLKVESLDVYCGAQPGITPLQPQATRSLDGRLWFANNNVIQTFDPHLWRRNELPPNVAVERVAANGVSYPIAHSLKLPALVRNLEIDYTALSFVVPQKVRFRYKLEGHDTEWQDSQGRRQAFYSDLRPGQYHFQVIACNNDGVWNDKGAHLDFEIAPTWYQTSWFRTACVGAFLTLMWGLYKLRLQQLRRQFHVRVEARVNERSRIARELHDTLLQSLHGLMFEFQAVRNMFHRRPEEALEALDGAIMGTERAITESQVAIEGLRDAEVAENDLAQLLRTTGEELVASRSADHDTPTFGLTVEGERRTLVPIIRDEVYRIAREVLRNAFRHAHARRIEAEILYTEHQFRLRVRDDGKGMDPQVLEEGGRAGHWGLPGLRERAQQMGAKLDLWSEAGTGTEVQLTVAAAIAYEKTPDRSGFRLFRRTRNHDHRS